MAFWWCGRIELSSVTSTSGVSSPGMRKRHRGSEDMSSTKWSSSCTRVLPSLQRLAWTSSTRSIVPWRTANDALRKSEATSSSMSRLLGQGPVGSQTLPSLRISSEPTFVKIWPEGIFGELITEEFCRECVHPPWPALRHYPLPATFPRDSQDVRVCRPNSSGNFRGGPTSDGDLGWTDFRGVPDPTDEDGSV